MDPTAVFADLTRQLFEVLLDGPSLTLEARVLEVNGALVGLLAAGASLPVAAGVAGGSGSPFDGSGWPGFGSYERYWTVGALAEPGAPAPLAMSEVLGFVAAELWRGLESWEAGDSARAVGCWSVGYEATWGPAATELLLALHPRVAAYRQDARGRARGRRPELGQVTLAATTGRGRPVLGVRFVLCPGGVEVRDVHPSGPAAGRLLPGDVIIAIEGESLDGLGLDEAGARMVGPIGQVRRYELLREGRTEIVRLAAVDAEALG